MLYLFGVSTICLMIFFTVVCFISEKIATTFIWIFSNSDFFYVVFFFGTEWNIGNDETFLLLLSEVAQMMHHNIHTSYIYFF